MPIDQTRLFRHALISEDTRYRYSLSRVWDAKRGIVAFIGLNPSTADAVQDDATIRTCMRYADSWGYGGICMLNLFAFRSRSPAVMKRAADPVGPDNDFHLYYLAPRAQRVIACWGEHGRWLDRARQVAATLPVMLEALAVNKGGTPHHPLYLPSGIVPQPYAHVAADVGDTP